MPQGNVQFDADNANEFGRPPQESGGFDLSGALVNAGLVSTREEAQYVMMGIAVFALIVAGFFIFRSGGGAPPPPPSQNVGGQA